MSKSSKAIPLKTEPKVFIIESLEFLDEEDQDFEGSVISQILNFARIENKYFYVRTCPELPIKAS